MYIQLHIYMFFRCTFQIFGGVRVGGQYRGGGDNSIQFINSWRVGDKSFKEWRRKIRGGGVGRVGDNSILTFPCYWLVKKNATLKNCILGNFSIRICKVSQFIDFFTGLKALSSGQKQNLFRSF